MLTFSVVRMTWAVSRPDPVPCRPRTGPWEPLRGFQCDRRGSTVNTASLILSTSLFLSYPSSSPSPKTNTEASLARLCP